VSPAKHTPQQFEHDGFNSPNEVEAAMTSREQAYRRLLRQCGEAIGYGRSQQILGELWDEMLGAEYGIPSGRGLMGVTIDDALPPLPKATKLRREMQPYGGYQMVPAYTVDEMKQFGHAAIAKAVQS
jgi:hypothetical protein